jgi:hypothetical protein
MTDATMSREEIAEFFAVIKKLRDDLGLMQIYLGRAVAVVSKTEESLKDVRTTRDPHCSAADRFVTSMEFDDALGHLKEFIVANIPPGMIEAHAFRLVGESQDTIDAETRDLFGALLQQSPPFPYSTASGLSFALREVVRDRIREIEENAA